MTAVTAAILYPLHIAFGKRRNKRRLQQLLTLFSDAELSYSIQIDEEKLVIVSTNETHEFPWTAFTAFGVHPETLYVFNTVNGINSLDWDQSGRGSEAYTGLLEMLKKRSSGKRFSHGQVAAAAATQLAFKLVSIASHPAIEPCTLMC